RRRRLDVVGISRVVAETEREAARSLLRYEVLVERHGGHIVDEVGWIEIHGQVLAHHHQLVSRPAGGARNAVIVTGGQERAYDPARRNRARRANDLERLRASPLQDLRLLG